MKHQDKIQHFCVSLVIAGLIYYFFSNILVAVYGALALGLLKEFYDHYCGRNKIKESLADILFDVLGIVVGIFLVRLLIR